MTTMIRVMLLTTLLATPAFADDGCPPATGGAQPVLRVMGEGALVMGDKQEIIVAGLAPRPSVDLGDALQRAIAGGTVQLSAPSGRPDRWGRHAVHLRNEGGGLVAESLIRAGEAIRAPGLEPEACRRHLDALEPKTPPSVRLGEDALGKAVRLSGRVTAQRRGSGRIYLDLASREAGKITVSWRDKANEDWTGRRLRLRGWLDWSNGLLVMVSAPFDVEIEPAQ